MPFEHGIAIIGAGLGGLSLAIFLHKYNIKCTIYELRPSTSVSTGAILLSPNALRSLDAISAYARIKQQGYHFQKLTFNTNDHKYMDAYEMGNVEKYGYDAFRIYRQPLLQELRAMVAEAGMEIVYEKKFSHVVSDSDGGVTFAFADGEEKTVDLLIGADGIYSTVRKYLYPDIKPTFSGVMSVFCAIPTAAIKLPFEDYPMPVSIHGAGGAFAIVPQLPDESESLGVIQYRTHERTREEWGELERDKDGLLQMMRESYDGWNEIVKSAMDNLWKDTLSIWAYYVVPKLNTWKSETGKVVMLGDAAHAIPPAAAQGVNQAFEDVHSLSLLMAAVQAGKATWSESLEWWQAYRQARVDRTLELTQRMNIRRLPGWTGGEGDTVDSSWLFGVDIEKDVTAWLEQRNT